MIEKRAYNNVKELLTNSVKIKSFEKNPMKGGTPAIEKMINVVTVR